MSRLQISVSVNRSSTTNATVETAAAADLDALCLLLRQLFAIEADFSFEPARARRGLELLLDEEGALLLVARNSGQVIGMCSAQKVISTAEGGYSVWVEDLVVDQAHRGKGIGRLLLDGISNWAQRQGAGRMQLLADNENDLANAFYCRNGWQRTQLTALRSAGEYSTRDL